MNANESNVYPYRVFGLDVFNALNVRLGIVIDSFNENEMTRVPPGFHLSLHSPDELIHADESLFLVPSEHDVYVSVRPATMTTSNGLRSYDPHKRGCYFQSERQLHFFRAYSQQKCQRECLTNFTTKECGCTHYSFPRKYEYYFVQFVFPPWNSFEFHFAGEEGTRICTIVDMMKFEVALMKYHVESHVKQCDCLPDCTSIIYHTAISQTPYHYYDDAEVKNIKKVYTNFGWGIFFLLKKEEKTTYGWTLQNR